MTNLIRFLSAAGLCAAFLVTSRPAWAAGTLLPTSSASDPPRIVAHHVDVRIDNGYVRTEVTQTFENPNPAAVEAIYSLPLPLGTALAEVTIVAGDRTLYGEVVPRDEAQQIYDAQVAAGAEVGLATKEGYQRFEFRIASIPPGDEAQLTFAYYQTITVEDGVARFLYPLEEGGTDPGADAFWNLNDSVEGTFAADIALRSAWPLEDVRLPDFESAATITQSAAGEVDIEIRAAAGLDRDLVLYYRLPDDLPGRVEVIPYRAEADGSGTFMMVLTPGADLEPLRDGADYVLVLDSSGSMEGKLETLKAAAHELIASLGANDRYRIVDFDSQARELTNGWVPAMQGGTTGAVDRLVVDGGTNLYAGLDLALQGLDAERATSILLVTDGVANEGLVDGPSFIGLLAERDVRLYGFLMGNSGNWPMLELLARVSGGFYAQVSNADDIAGRMHEAREKMTHEALHGFRISLDGGEVFDLSEYASKVHRGEQVVLFGRYDAPGPVTVDVDATITGRAQHYAGAFDFPAQDTRNPELERLWAFAHIRFLEYQSDMELVDAADAAERIASLGVEYQLVTDETSMILLSDEDFARLGIDPTARERSEREAEASALREAGEPVDYSTPLDSTLAGGDPYRSSYGSSGGGSDDAWGGGAVRGRDAAWLAFFALALAALGFRRRRSGR